MSPNTTAIREEKQGISIEESLRASLAQAARMLPQSDNSDR